MDDARKWTATAPRADAESPTAVQPPDPWGAPVWSAEPRAVGSLGDTSAVPAGVRRRGIALVIDLIVVVILWAVGMQLAAWLARVAPRLDLVALAFERTWQVFVPVAYFTLGHGTAGQTIGKRILGARVIDEGGDPIGYLRALGRCAATVTAALPLGIGLAMAGLRRDRRGLHDFLAGTRVVRVP
jgi:uncharacterized RDD family membrane protein YckC